MCMRDANGHQQVSVMQSWVRGDVARARGAAGLVNEQATRGARNSCTHRDTVLTSAVLRRCCIWMLSSLGELSNIRRCSAERQSERQHNGRWWNSPSCFWWNSPSCSPSFSPSLASLCFFFCGPTRATDRHTVRKGICQIPPAQSARDPVNANRMEGGGANQPRHRQGGISLPFISIC